MADVARECSVSTATVSYVLNDAPGRKISAETRRRVLEAAERLGYVPNNTAKALRTGRTEIVVLDVSGVPEGPGAVALASAFCDRLHRDGMSTVIRSVHSTPLPLHELAAAVSPFAVASLSPIPAEDARRLRRAGVSLVSGWDFGQPAESPEPDWFHAGNQAQIRHLAARGHTHVAYAHLPAAATRRPFRHRAEGAREACRALALPDPVEIMLADEPHLVAETLRRLRRDHPGVTAVAAVNDVAALTLLGAAQRLGLGVPRDLALMGFDDIPLARHACPPLTTVRTEVVRLGAEFAARLLEAMGRSSGGADTGGPYWSVVARESA